MLSSVLIAQQGDHTIKGYVVELNSKYETGEVVGVDLVLVESGGSTVLTSSDPKGYYELVFADKPKGTLVPIKTSRSGYDAEPVNSTQIKEGAEVGRLTPLKIVLSREGQLAENRRRYYLKAKESSIQFYNTRIATLEAGGLQQQLLIDELKKNHDKEVLSLNQAKALLFEELQEVEKRAEALADKYYRVNLDDQSEDYQRAFRAFMDGDIEKAILINNSLELDQRLEANYESLKKEEALINELEGSVKNRKTQIKQDLNQLVWNAQLQILAGRYAQAEQSYESAANLSKNPEIMLDYGSFLLRQNKMTKSIAVFDELLEINDALIISDRERYLEDRGRIYNELAGALVRNRDYEKASNYIDQTVEIRKELVEKNAKEFLPALVRTLINKGTFLTQKGDIFYGKQSYEEALDKARENLMIDPKNPLVVSNLISILNNYGLFLKDFPLTQRAIESFEEALEFTANENFVNSNEEHAMYLRSWTLNNLGMVYSESDKIEDAFQKFMEGIQIRRELVDKNPERHTPDLAQSLNSFGRYLASIKKYDEAIKIGEESLALNKEMASKEPRAFKKRYGLSAVNLALMCKELLMITNEVAYKTRGVALAEIAMEQFTSYELVTMELEAYISRTQELLDFYKNYE